MKPDVPPLPMHEVTPTTVQLFEFSAVTWNPHRIHFDTPYAQETEGYPGVLVHGPLLGSWLMRIAENWVCGWGSVTSITYRSLVALPVNTPVVVTGEIASIDDGHAVADVWVERSDGTRVCEGHVVADLC